MDHIPKDGHRIERNAETTPDYERLEPALPPEFYYRLDESDPDVTILRREDGTFVAAFSAQGATREGVLEAAEEDFARLDVKTCTAPVARPRTAT